MDKTKASIVALILFFALGSRTLAQDTSLYRLSIHYQPLISAIANEDKYQSPDISNDKPIFGNAFGIELNYFLSNRIALSVATQFSRKGFQFSHFSGYMDTSTLRQLTEMSDNPDWDYLAWEKSVYYCNYYFVGMPLSIKYRFINTASSEFDFIAGIIPNLLIGRKTKVFEYMTYETNKRVFSDILGENEIKFYLSGIIGVGFSKSINQKLGYYLRPKLEYLIMETNDWPVYGHIYNIGMDIGVYYDF